MRRTLSILLALVLGLGPMISAVPASALISGWTGKADESRLPACCRRNGKHHCAMAATNQTAGPAGETTVSARETCPCMPRTLASTAPSVTAVLHSTAVAITLPAEPHAAHASTHVARTSDLRSQPKRGPPASQLL